LRSSLCCLLLLTACSPVRRRAEGDIVHSISFSGNGGLLSGHDDYQLRQQMSQQEAAFGLLTWPFIYVVEPVVFDVDKLREDIFRLEVWYAHHGWFDARVEGWDLRRVRRETQRRAGVVDIHGTLTLGERSLVRSLEVEGVPPTLVAVRNALLRRAPIRVGDGFDLEYAQATGEQLENKMLEHGHPYAQVSVSTEAHPVDRAVDVVLHAEPGIEARIGEIEVEGNEVVDEKIIRTALERTLEPGRSYDLQDLRAAQRQLFAMGTFSVATIEPDLSDPTNPAVPIRVKVTESKFRTFRLGGGFDYDSQVPILRAQTQLEHTNLFREMLRAELGLSAGVAVDISEGADFSGRLPTWGADLELTYPRLFRYRGEIDLSASIEQDIFGGLWSYRSPEVDLGFSYQLTDAIRFRVGPHFENYVFLGEFGDKVQAAQQRLFGIESDEAFEYQLTTLDQFVSFDWRDDPLAPTRGSFSTIQLREAIPITDLGYGFIRATAEQIRYIPIRAKDRTAVFPFSFVTRARATGIVPYGDTEVIPLPERAFVGGPTSVRGFRTNQVGDYDTLCTYNEVTTGGGLFGLGEQSEETRLTRYHLPKGGSVASDGTVELRYDWAYGLVLAAFVDGGVLADSITTMKASDLRGSAGVGVRYQTPVGPLRFDISIRDLYAEDFGPANYRNCLDGDRQPRIYDVFSNFPGLREENHPSFAMVFFFTIGTAF
jgi:outer membrane protein insertion porin family